MISMDELKGHKTLLETISVHKENNPRFICVTGKGLIVAEMTKLLFGVS